MTRFVLICSAGAAGTGVRYLVGLTATRFLGPALPWGTLAVNLTGCFLMSAVMAIAASEAGLSETSRLVLTTGFMGGLTTYSAFNFETTHLFTERAPWISLVYFAATTIGCLVTGIVGTALARRFW